jgi:transglutaminase-like putative cysteine protease
VVLKLAPAASAGPLVRDQLIVTLDGRPLPVREESSPVGGRTHVLASGPGLLNITYEATVGSPTASSAPGSDVWEALRPSRYCPSDKLQGWAVGEFGGSGQDVGTVLDRVRHFVNRRTAYVAGFSGPTDDAVDTLLSGQGVCRDFAHLLATIGRALEMPTRLASVWAPGLSPMDFHAVVEVLIDGEWRVLDATGLAPRHHLVRIATGRDAADTAFAEVLGGEATLTDVSITAVVDGDLTPEDPSAVVVLA